jgi:murein DD-endopeptidase MepM/ murein hydrolase activator NlpD
MPLRHLAIAAALLLAGAAWLAWARTDVASPPVADGFDFPVGPPDARGYYDAQPFGVNDHLGCDWNGLGGGRTDLGDPVMSIASGTVTFAEDVGGGWGNVVRVRHRVRGEGDVESLYAHLDRIDVAVGDRVLRGQVLGTLGDAHGRYSPHLHLELRSRVGMDLGGGYARERDGYLDPTEFIHAHRPADRAR